MQVYKFIADYQDKKGNWYHRPFMMVDPAGGGRDAAIRKIKKRLKKEKFKLKSITEFFGDDIGMDELIEAATKDINKPHKMTLY